jgi:hypothetical protein
MLIVFFTNIKLSVISEIESISFGRVSGSKVQNVQWFKRDQLLYSVPVLSDIFLEQVNLLNKHLLRDQLVSDKI